jgi:segregation and condensation protein A
VEQDYKVKLDVFEGPLDLLLYLIKRDEVDIYDISIEHITKQYLEYLDSFQILNIELAGEFIVMAANLLYIKSRTLLPVDQRETEEEEEEPLDPRWELIRQLIEYRKFKEAAGQLRLWEARQECLFPRIPGIPELEVEENLLVEEVGMFDLIRALQKVLERTRKTENREIFEEHFSVSDKINFVMAAISPGQDLRFEDFFAESASRTEIVVTFLALLELIRMKQLTVRQEGQFEEIWIARPSSCIVPP